MNHADGGLDFYNASGDKVNGENKDGDHGIPNPFKQSQSWIYARNSEAKPVEKKPFLRKGTGTARYYRGRPLPASLGIHNIVSHSYPASNGNSTSHRSSPSDDCAGINSRPSPIRNPEPKEKDDELQLFELLEQMTEGQSFCSNSPIPQGHYPNSTDILNKGSTLNGNSENHADNNRGNIIINNSNQNKSSDLQLRKLSESPSPNTEINHSGSMESISGSANDHKYDKNNSRSVSPVPQVLHQVLKLVREESVKPRKLHEVGVTRPHLQGAILTARTMELEHEIKRFKDENQKITDLRQQWQNKCSELEYEQKQFEQLKDRELRFIEDEKARLSRKKERLNKLIHEQEKLDEKTTAEDEELNRLRTTVCQLEKELKLKNSRLRAQKKLEEQICLLEEKNKTLCSELDAIWVRRKDQNSSRKSCLVSVSTGMEDPILQEPAHESVYNLSASSDSPRCHSSAFTYVDPSQPRSRSNDIHEQTVSKVDNNTATEPTETILPSGDRETRYANGTIRLISADCRKTKVNYYNGDIRETTEDGIVRYYYCESGTWHTVYPDCLEVVEFKSGQIEKKLPNGITETKFSDGCIKTVYPCGKEECVFPDNTVLKTERNGDKVLLMANGQKEYQTKEFRKRIYPDGTVKIVYNDGSQETRYPSGRIRMRDANGKLMHDAFQQNQQGTIR